MRRGSGGTSRRFRATPGSSSNGWTSPTPTRSTASRRPSRSPSGRGAVGRDGARSGRSRRSTTHLALLYARVGKVTCPELRDGWSSPPTHRAVVRAVEGLPEGTRYLVAFPLDVRPDSDLAGLAEALGARTVHPNPGRRRGSSGSKDGPLPDGGRGRGRRRRRPPDQGSEAAGRRLDSIETAFAKGMGRARIIGRRGRAGPDLRPEAAVPGLRARLRRPGPSPLPLQQPARGLPDVRRVWLGRRPRTEPDRPRPLEDASPRGPSPPGIRPKLREQPPGPARGRGLGPDCRSTCRSRACLPRRRWP